MVRNFRKISLGLVCVLAMPVVASAQSQMTGLVRDESGGVLPGVTVEAASPVLIEKMRSAITDANGRFTIGDLRQGVYTVTFSLTGFWTVVRDEFNLPGDFIATINVDMKVGALEEIITVRTRILTKSEVRISAAGRSI
jgi:iron complex outermembrane receptor protein